MLPAEPKWPVKKSLGLVTNILTRHIFFHDFSHRSIFLLQSAPQKTGSIKKAHCPSCWQAHSPGPSHWDYTLSSHYSKPIYICMYMYIYVCVYNLSLRWNYTDLARWLAHLNFHPASRLWSYLCLFEWFAILFSRGPLWLRDCTQVSCIASRFFTIWATREALFQGREYIQVIWKGFCQTFSLKINYFLKNIPW